MAGSRNDQTTPLRVVHVLRAPVGGLFRHVVDLTHGQIARGHAVGLIIDSRPQDARTESALVALAQHLTLGLSRVPIERNPHPSDVAALRHVAQRLHDVRPDVLHGHGSKGGALARLSGFLPGLPRAARAYTPHGGSLNYRPGSVQHALYMEVERWLRRRTDLLLFESGFIASRYGQMVGRPPRLNRVIHNGIAASEFEAVELAEDAADFVYVGELRSAKGIDTLLLALSRVAQLSSRVLTLSLVGSGPDRELLQRQAQELGLGTGVTFHGAMPVRSALSLGQIMVVPSRAESLPYVVLEAAAAGKPLVATNVGGIPEIFGPQRRRLIPCDSVAHLASAMLSAAEEPAGESVANARALSRYVQSRFSLDRMVDSVLSAYREALTPATPTPILRAGQPVAISP